MSCHLLLGFVQSIVDTDSPAWHYRVLHHSHTHTHTHMRVTLAAVSGQWQGWRNDWRGGGTRPRGPPRKRVPKCLKGPKTTYTTIAIAEKQSKRSKKGPLTHFVIYIGSFPGPTQEMELMGPGGEGPSRPPPRFLQPWPVVSLSGQWTPIGYRN